MMSNAKIFGIGWAKTGTSTLGECLQILGSRHISRRFDLVNYFAAGDTSSLFDVLRKYGSAEDWPWLLMYRELAIEYPDARFVLTVRDSERWLASYMNMIGQEPRSDHMDLMRSLLYGVAFPNPDPSALMARYEEHNRSVRHFFAEFPERLLVIDWSRHGWEELCEFLGEGVPDVPFPTANRGTYRGPVMTWAVKVKKQLWGRGFA